MTTDDAIWADIALTPLQRLEQLNALPDVQRAELRAALADLVSDIAARVVDHQTEAAERCRIPLPDPLRGLPRTINGRSLRTE